ncbi:EAL domain-containing protein [Altererythrobacter aerius]|uniref:EAL domain-containing protein n=1 Tax=Tsuneonella aeria TaxID=1837929 RepID=A0A6I4TB06_9SPHN|nr:EAL domain-containing protein [Tsuneonella aeria]MXO73934.1 EAL domain-containing protein [Tsuneonella aeria]
MGTVADKSTADGQRARVGPLRAWLRRALAWRRRGRPIDPRTRILAWAIGLGLISGAIELFEPLEDAFRAVRAMVREHPADQSIVVVNVDEYSLSVLGGNEPRRSDDAKLLDNLFAMGAKRVFFDRAYADLSTPAEDAKLVEAFKRYRGRVFVGAVPNVKRISGENLNLKPNPYFAPHVNIVSILGQEGPLGLAIRFPTESKIGGEAKPSLSAELANVRLPEQMYRIDLAIDHATVPTMHYLDLLNGDIDRAAVAGKDFVVSPPSRMTYDFHPIPFQQKVAGAILHAVGAQTLKKGVPIESGWIMPFLVACAFLLYQARRVRPSRTQFAAVAGLLLIVPLGLDFLLINVDIFAAICALAIGGVRFHMLDRMSYRGSTDLRRIETAIDMRSDSGTEVLAIKLRNFATISANLAAEQVDELLGKVQARLRATQPDAEFLFEKDTFVWLQPRVDGELLEDHLRGLHALFNINITVGAHSPDVATAIGADTNYSSPLRERIESAIQCAEDAARAGRIFMISEEDIVEDRAWRLEILSELESAIRHNEVEVLYQPKVSLKSGAIIGAEALLRWRHPVRGMIDPSKVIKIAEEHNRVDMITRFVLNRALSQARAAIAADPAFRIAINISALDLRDPLFTRQLRQLLKAYRVPAGNLVIEITETAPIDNDEVVAAVFAEIKAMGVKLSVDDFGMGHASLHYLRRIPADEVKIDRSFVSGMDNCAEDAALVRSAIEMIHSLGRIAVAEGVERPVLVQRLHEMGCDAAQGYHFSKAIPMAQLLPQLRDKAVAA